VHPDYKLHSKLRYTIVRNSKSAETAHESGKIAHTVTILLSVGTYMIRYTDIRLLIT